MINCRHLKRLFFRLVILLTMFFSIFSMSGYGKEPILEYLFNETGKCAYSSGSDDSPLVFRIASGREDLHSAGGIGVSGASTDRAFDNYSWCEPFEAGIAEQEEISSTIPALKSLTIQGWFKMDQIPGTYVHPTHGSRNEATLIRGPFMLHTTSSPTSVGLKFRARPGEGVASVRKYTITNEWVFFAVTFDKTKDENNIIFYVGSKSKPVEFVSTHTYAPDFRTDLKFGVGAINPRDWGMFYGFLDNIRLYGSEIDSTGVLTLEELEIIRNKDLSPPDSPPTEMDEELDRQLTEWANQLNEYEEEFGSFNAQTEYAIEIRRKALDKIVSLRKQIASIRVAQIIKDFEARQIKNDMIMLENALSNLFAISEIPFDTSSLLVSVTSPISERPVLPYSPDDISGIHGILEDRLYVVATPGEYEPASFVVHALRDINALEVEVSDLKMDESRIDASNIDVKVVKCWYQAGSAWKSLGQNKQNKVLVPELLLNDDTLVKVDYENKENYLKLSFPDGEKYVWISDSKDETRERVILPFEEFPVQDSSVLLPVGIPANTNKQFWITVKVPDNAPPGIYKGCIKLHSNKDLLANLSLFVRVLPFKLAQPYYDSSIYYRGKLEPSQAGITSEFKSEGLLRKELENLLAHGVTNPRLLIRLKRPGFWEEGPDLEELEKVLKIRESLGMLGEPLHIYPGAYNFGFDINIPSTPERLGVVKKHVRDVLDVTRRYNVPEVYFYAIDEARGDRLIAQREVWQAIHEAGGKIDVAGYTGSFDLVGDYLDLLICAGYPDPNEIKKWHGADKKIYCYDNPQGGVENPEVYRRNFGLLLWKYGYDGACTFAYQHGFGNIWNDFDHIKYRDHNFTYPTVDGVIDTIAWEGYREAVDDVRYVTTLMQMIEEVKNTDNIEKKTAAVAAETYLTKLKQDVENRNLDIVRLEIINHILKLQGQN